MKKALIAAGVVVSVTVVFVAATYPGYRRQMAETKSRLAAGSSVLKTGHADIEYAVEGRGVPVLVLHGAGGGYDQGLWIGRLTLGDGYKLISVSRYGYLRSSMPADASIRSQAALYKELLDFLEIPKVIVVGGSAGGPSAIQFANDYPERTLALILVSAVSEAGAPGDKAPFYVGIIHLLQRSDYAYWITARFMQPTILELMGIPETAYDKFTPDQKQMAQDMLDTMHPMTQRYAGTANDERMIQRDALSAEHVKAPVLILHAKDDKLVSYHHAEHAKELIPGAQLKLFDEGGHGLLSQMNAVRQDVAGFLAQL